MRFCERNFGLIPLDGVPDEGDGDSVIELKYSSSWEASFDVLVAKVASENDTRSKFVEVIELDDCDLTSNLNRKVDRSINVDAMITRVSYINIRSIIFDPIPLWLRNNVILDKNGTISCIKADRVSGFSTIGETNVMVNILVTSG